MAIRLHIVVAMFYQEQIADYEVVEFRAMKFHPSLAALV
jgi:hypothetical protein